MGACEAECHRRRLIVVGAIGVGKTFLGAALAQAACRQEFRALCVRVPRLVQDLSVARADGTNRVELQRLARFDVLVLDDLLIGPLSFRFQKNSRSLRGPSRDANSRADNPLAAHCCTRSFQNRSSRRNRAIRRPPRTQATRPRHTPAGRGRPDGYSLRGTHVQLPAKLPPTVKS
jgi:hypothetical protein